MISAAPEPTWYVPSGQVDSQVPEAVRYLRFWHSVPQKLVLGFRVCRVQGSRVCGLGFGVIGFGIIGFRVIGFGIWGYSVWDLGI